jgi:hypothetical protein
MALTPKGLEKIIKEQIRSILQEQPGGLVEKQPEDSIDKQIDDLLIDYESDSKIKKNEGFDFRSMTRRFLLNTIPLTEAEEKDAEAASPKTQLTLNDIDVEEFANHVVRLIDNYDSLLEVRNTIARRAINFLLENYEPTVVKQFEVVMEDQHDIVIGKSKADQEDEKSSPPAVGSGGMPNKV